MQVIEEHPVHRELKETQEREEHVDQLVCPRIILYIMHSLNQTIVSYSSSTKRSIINNNKTCKCNKFLFIYIFFSWPKQRIISKINQVQPFQTLLTWVDSNINQRHWRHVY